MKCEARERKREMTNISSLRRQDQEERNDEK